MKKVIRGRVYDTETAEQLGSVTGGAEFTNDFNYWAETLYRKKTGEFFLHCEGGALSRYAEHIGSNSGWGEKIKTLSYSEAEEWAEKNLEGDEYIRIFGDPEDNWNKKTIAVSITQGAADILRRAAQQSGKSASETIEMLIREHLT